jgi:glucan phosphoethanolaminetransferase (alkaline phosphatase superfamily)
MQRQQEREPTTRQKPPRLRRSVGELLTAWLLVLFGAGCAYMSVPEVLKIVRDDANTYIFRWYIVDVVLIFVQASLCLVAGVGTLLRQRLLARWTLRLAGLCCIGLACFEIALTYSVIARVMEKKDEPTLWMLWFFLPVALLLFFLGWWLGRQEDSEA